MKTVDSYLPRRRANAMICAIVDGTEHEMRSLALAHPLPAAGDFLAFHDDAQHHLSRVTQVSYMSDATSALASVLVEILASRPNPASTFYARPPSLEADVYELNEDFTIGARYCELPSGVLPAPGDELNIAYPVRELNGTHVLLQVVARLWNLALTGDMRVSMLTVDAGDPLPPKTWPSEHHLPSFLDAAFIHTPSWLR